MTQKVVARLEEIPTLPADGKRYVCPLCEGEVSVKADLFYGKCEVCNMTLIDYVPLEHQEGFHKSKAKYKLNIGGFGTGKTTMVCAEIANHVLTIPGARFLITAPTLKQVTDAVLKELDKFIPSWLLVGDRYTKKPTPHYTLKNGSEILVYASDDPENIKTLNLTGFYMEEASGIKGSVFTMLKTRLRNTCAVVYDEKGKEIKDNFLGLISSNPEDCWFIDEFLLLSGNITCSKNVDKETYEKLMKGTKTEPSYHSFLSSSTDNPYLPVSYIKDMCVGKTPSWIRKYVDCFLGVKEGAVYKEFIDMMIEPFDIPKHWLRIAGFDKGFRDPTAFLIGAIDPITGVIYVYDEYYVAEQPVSYHAKKIPAYLENVTLFMPVQADPSIRTRSEYSGASYKDYFRNAANIHLEEANNSLFYGIEKVRDYMSLGKLKFFNSLKHTKEEALKYVYKDVRTGEQDAIVDKYNHLMDCLRYMIAKLPENPIDLVRVVGIKHSSSFKGATLTKNGMEFIDNINLNKATDSFKTKGGVTTRWKRK